MGIKVLSLFDGMSCGMIAMQKAGLDIEEYIAYEIDKYAIKTATHNFPMIKECGDVFTADFTQYKDIDYIIGGSPCTYWSIAQKNNRETEASGMGWELFTQYVRAIHEAKPEYFIYENNKSMSNAIRESITETFGFEPICINSALVSAQNRQRLYWVGKRNSDGTYSNVDVKQPKDKGIILKDVLNGLPDRLKGHAVICSAGRTSTREYFLKSQGNMCFEPVNITCDCKAQTLKAQYCKNNVANFCCYSSTYGATGVAEPVCVQEQVYGRKAQADGTYDRRYEARNDGKAGTLTGTMRQNALAEPVCMRYVRSDAAKRCRKQYERGEIHHGFHELSELQPRTDGKTNTISTVQKDNPICEPVCEELCGKTGCYAIPVEYNGVIPVKAKSFVDGKIYTVYEVKDGQITIRGKRYAIKLADGYYIIRKLTVEECKRLQTVPDWYVFPVSDTQAYKLLGNGWTVDVIVHLINSCIEAENIEDKNGKCSTNNR